MYAMNPLLRAMMMHTINPASATLPASASQASASQTSASQANTANVSPAVDPVLQAIIDAKKILKSSMPLAKNETRASPAIIYTPPSIDIHMNAAKSANPTIHTMSSKSSTVGRGHAFSMRTSKRTNAVAHIGGPLPRIQEGTPTAEQFSIAKDKAVDSLVAMTELRVPQKTELGTGQNGDLILNTNDGTFYGFNGIMWMPLGFNNSPVLQIITETLSAPVVCTGHIANSNTLPTINDGTFVLSASITPISTVSNLMVSFVGSATSAALQPVTTALIQSGSNNAIATSVTNSGGVDYAINSILTFTVPSVSLAARTFSIYIGGTSANVVVNGDAAGNPLYGGTMDCSLTVTEVLQPI